MKYEVFARVRAGDELIHVGNVDAETDRLARSFARSTFGEEEWNRMVVVRRDGLIEVTGDHRAESPSGGSA